MVTDHIQIGTVCSVGHPDEWQLIPDDRQQLVPTIGGVVVEDYGHCANGDKYSCTATFTSADYTTLSGYWTNRTLVTVTEEDTSQVHTNCRIVIRSVKYPRLLPQYKQVQFEVWLV